MGENISNPTKQNLMPTEDLIRVKKDGMIELPDEWCADHSIDEGDWLVARIEDNTLRLMPFRGPMTEAEAKHNVGA